MSNNKQPTAVEKLESFFRTHCNPSVCNIEWSDFNTAFLEAKAMHKEEMKNFTEDWYHNGPLLGVDVLVSTSIEKHYNETYGGNNDGSPK